MTPDVDLLRDAAARRRQVRARVLLLGLPLATGAGLVLHILAGIDLRLALAVLVAAGAGVWAVLVPRLPADRRRDVRRRVGIGAVAGLVGTLSYDVARYGTVALFDLSFRPFHVFEVFGHLFLGQGASPTSAFIAGAVYHLTNGTGFGIAYVLAVRRPGPLTGMVWGVLLELCMATLYPAWLRIQQFGEFLQVSATGHLVYGAVLGLVAARLLSVAAGPGGGGVAGSADAVPGGGPVATADRRTDGGEDR